MWLNSEEFVDLVTCTEKILIRKLHFLCSVLSSFDGKIADDIIGLSHIVLFIHVSSVYKIVCDYNFCEGQISTNLDIILGTVLL